MNVLKVCLVLCPLTANITTSATRIAHEIIVQNTSNLNFLLEHAEFPHNVHGLSDHGLAASRSASRNTAGESTRRRVLGFQLRRFPKLYPSLDSIIIRNATTLKFVRSVAFWEAFPAALHGHESIQCLSVDPGMKLVRSARVSYITNDVSLNGDEIR